MRWDAVSAAVFAALQGSTVLDGVYGTAIRKAGVRKYEVPSLEYSMLSDSVSEIWAPHVFQFDQFCPSMEDLVASERELRRLFDFETPQWIEGVYMFAFYDEGGELEGPDRESATDVFARAARFRFVPIRERLLEGRS